MAEDQDDVWIDNDPSETLPESQAPEEIGRPWSEVRPEFLALIDKNFPI
jgi:hypothetical protein